MAKPERSLLSQALLVTAIALLVSSVVLIIHWPVLDAQAMCHDDKEAIVENQLLQNPSWHSVGRFFSEFTLSSVVRGYYRPLTLTSLMLDWAMGGRPENLRAFHRTSLALHVGSTVLIILLCYQIFGRPLVAAMVGLLFGLHPMTVEPIAWVMERKTILAAIFAFGCLNAYVRYTRIGSRVWYVAAVGSYLISLLAKPTVIPLPVMMLLMDLWPLHRFSGRTVLEKVPFVFLAAVFAILCVVCEQKVNPLTLPATLSPLHLPLRLCWLMVFYPFKIMLPVCLSSIYMLPEPLALSNGIVLLAVMLVVVFVSVLVLCRRRFPCLWISVVSFYIGLSPTMGFVGYSWVSASDKYVYFPAVALLLLLAWLLGLLAGDPMKARPLWRPIAVGVFVVTSAVLLGVGTRQYIAKWETMERHEFYMFSLAPNSPETNFGYGNVFFEKGKYDRAIAYYTRAIELNPNHLAAYCNRGKMYCRINQFDKAISDFTKAIDIRSDCAEVYEDRGAAYYSIHAYDRAIYDYTNVIKLKPDCVDNYIYRGNVYASIKDYTHALQDYGSALELKPAYAEAYHRRGIAYCMLGDYEHSIQDFSKVIKLQPDSAEAYYNRAVAYSIMKDYDKAIQDYTEAIKLRPDHANTFNNRGNAYLSLHDYAQAIKDHSKAIELNPDYAEAYNNRGAAYNDNHEYEQAVRDYSKAIELRTDYAEAYSNRGEAYIKLHDYNRAIQDCGRAIELKSDYAEAYNNRASAYFSIGVYDKAREDIARCKQLGGQVNPDFIKALAQVSSRPD